MTIKLSARLNWMDWMKALGMYVIILGHTFPVGLCPFIYSFSVPLFFFISGFLDKRATSWKECITKCVQTLLIPYLLICVGNLVLLYFQEGGSWTFSFLMQKLFYISVGLHNLFGVRGCGSMWFVYSLIVIKILFYGCNDSRQRMIGLSVLGIIGALLFNHIIGKGFGWAVTNTMLAFAYYVLGHLSVNYLKREYNVSCWILSFGIVLLGSVLFYLSNVNDAAYMYLGWYGNYIFLFYLCALLGIGMMYFIALLLNPIRKNWVRTIAEGSILILGFHEQLLPFMQYFNLSNQEGCFINLLKLIFSFIVLILFVPLIKVVKYYCPILMGWR